MLVNLTFASAGFEALYEWLEQHPGLAVEVWGLETGRRMALVAYSDGPGDDFGWANWVRSACADPSQLSALFETLELVADIETADQLKAALPDVMATSPT
jgi:hypothetical protein